MKNLALPSFLLAIVAMCLFPCGSATAALLQVPEDYTSIAAGLAVASHGDTVSLATGTYYEHDLTLPLGVSLLGRGGSAESVVIDAQGLGRVLRGDDLDEWTTLAYFTAKNGEAGGYSGAGLRLGDEGITSGWGFVLHHLVVEDCGVIQGGYGSGVYCRYPALIEDCVFRNNGSPGSSTDGGGLLLVTRPQVHTVVRRVDFIGNEAGRGGAIYVGDSSHFTLDSIRAFHNRGNSAIETYGEGGVPPSFLIENTIIAHNEGAGIHVVGSGWIRNCTILDCNEGVVVAGAWNGDSNAYIENCLITENHAGPGGGGVHSIPNGGYYWVSCSNVYGNLPVDYLAWDQTGIDGNISENPLFCPGAGPESYPIRDDSPCAPKNNECGLLMGAFPPTCDSTGTADTSWSAVKALY